MSDLQNLFNNQRSLTRSGTVLGYTERREALNKLERITVDNEADIIAAISEDFGYRAPEDTVLGDIIMALSGIKHTRRHLKKWMKPKHVGTALQYLPGRSKIEYQPLGVVGVIAPWNYPYQLAIVPAVQALAAGNRVMIKPSELAPKTSDLMAKLIAENFDPEILTVVTGDAEVGKEFSSLPFDHLFFTGSTQVGRIIAGAAAKNLTPVTLELGGKSPAILGKGASLGMTAPRLAFGKFLNAGQTCISPDYALVHKDDLEAFTAKMKSTVESFFPDGSNSKDYSSIVSDRHYDRLKSMTEEAASKGANVIPLLDADDASSNARKFVPTLVSGVNDDMTLMREEIFGPILPVKTYENLDEAISYVNDNERPLALYTFGLGGADKRRVLDETTSGGVTIDDCVWHFGQEGLPFGGVGASGMGSYHGEHGFRLFSHAKAVFTQSRLSTLFLIFPPYGKVGHLVGKFVKAIL